jgi:dTDP-D-glucose 4,6-dehydratase
MSPTKLLQINPTLFSVNSNGNNKSLKNKAIKPQITNNKINPNRKVLLAKIKDFQKKDRENKHQEKQTHSNSTENEKEDINNLEFLYDCDYIINLAAETHVDNSIVNSNDFVHTNINGVHNILELIKNYRQETNKKPVLLHFSTDEVYGDIIDGFHTEEDLLKPSNPYSATKAAADMLILA